MKTIYLRKTIQKVSQFSSVSVLLILMIGISMLSVAQTNRTWDRGANTNNWGDANNWNPNGVPGTLDPVTLATVSGNVNIIVNVNATCASLTFPSGVQSDLNLNISTAITLNVGGTITIPRAGGSGTTYQNILAVGAGILNAGTLSFTNTGSSRRHLMTISTGTATISGNITTSNTSDDSPAITFSGAGLLKIGGSIYTSSQGDLETFTGSTVEYYGSGDQTIESFTYYNLTVSGSGIKTLPAATTVSGLLTVTSATVRLGNNNVLSTPPVALNGGTFSTGATTGFSETVGTLDLNANSTIALGTGIHSLNFAASNGVSWAGSTTLTITGWIGTVGGSGSAGKIYVGSNSSGLTSDQLTQITFSGFSPGAMILDNGEIVPAGPFLSATPASLAFGYVASGSSSILNYTLLGGNLNGTSVTITAPAGFKVSTDNVNFYTTITIPYTAPTLSSTTIYVGFEPTGTPDDYIGNVTNDDDGSAVTKNVTVTGTSILTSTYCTSSGNLTFETAVTLVNFNTINNATSSDKTVGYNDFTSLSTDITLNSSYNLTVNVNTDGLFTVYARTWIDWNQDGDFADSGEEYNLGTAYNTSNGSTNLCPLSITIPSTATLGNTRMRVSARYNGYPTSCQTNFDGEVEDYTVSVQPYLCTWTGTTSTDWNVSTNWSCGVVPNREANVTIPYPLASNRQPVIPSTPNGICNNLTLANNNASLTINAGQALTVYGNLTTNSGTLTIESSYSAGPPEVWSSGSLIVKGTSTGSVIYKRQFRTYSTTPPYSNFDWHYFSSPVTNVTATTSSYITNIYEYTELTNSWGIGLGNTFTNFVKGKGYNLDQDNSSNGSISFTGDVVNTNFSISVTSPYDQCDFAGGDYSERTFATGRNNTTNYGGGGWNLLGNPFTSALKVSGLHGFLSINSTQFDPNYKADYIYNGNVGDYGTYYFIGTEIPGYSNTGVNPGNTFGYTDIQVGQGFFVLARCNGSTFSFTPGMQIHNTAVPMTKSIKDEDPWPGIYVNVSQGEWQNSTLIVYNNEMTIGLDPGYDVGLLSSGNDMEIYTQLISVSDVNFARQALPLGDYETNIIPVGIDTENGGEVTFSAEIIPIEGYKFLIEDRLTNTFTDLSTNTYTITLPAQTYGTGRFYIHVGLATGINESQMSAQNQLSIKVWTFDHQLNIEGELSSQAIGTIYDVMGRLIVEKRLTGDKLNTITVPSSLKGVYLLRVTDGEKVATRKVVF